MAVSAGTAALQVVPTLTRNFSRQLAGQMTGPMTKAGTQAGQRSGQESGRRFGRHFSGGIRAGIGPVRGIFRGFGPQLAAAFGTAALVAGIKSVTAEARESVRVGKITEARLKSTGAVAGVTAKQIEALAESLSNKLGIDDEIIQSGENMMLTFRGVRNEAGKNNDIFTRATKLSIDLAAGLHEGEVSTKGLQGTTIMLGKALEDPVRGLTALRRVGVSFTKQQQDQIKALVASGKTLEAQKLILKAVEQQFGGTAAASADAGKRFGVFVANLKEQVGKALLPVLNRFLGFLIDKLPGAIKTAQRVLKPLTIAVGALVTSFADPGVTTKGFVGLLQQIGSAARGLYDAGRKAAGELLKGIQEKFDEFKPKLATFKDRLVAGIKQFAQPVIDALKVGIATGDWEPLGRALGDALLATLRGAGDLSGKFLAWAREQATKVDWVEIGKTVGSHAFGFAVGFASALGSDLVKTLREHPLDFATAVIGFLGVGKLGGLIAKILAKIPFLRAFAPLFSSLNKLTAPINNAIGKVAGLFGRGFREGLERVFPAIGKLLDGLLTGQLLGGVRRLFGRIRGAGAGLVRNLGVGIGEQAGLVVRNIGQLIGFITRPFRAAGGWLIRGGVAAIKGLVAGIRRPLAAVTAAIRDVVIRITRPFGGAMTWIRDRWLAGWKRVREVGAAAWAALRAGLANFLSPFRARWNAGVTWVKDRWVAVWNRIREVGAAAWSVLKAGARGFVGSFKRIIGGIVGAIATPFRAAARLINTFIGGIESIGTKVGLKKGWLPARIPRFQAGGSVPGAGTGDKVIAALEPQEIVIPNRRRDRQRLMRDPAIAGQVADMAAMRVGGVVVPGYAAGGTVGRSGANTWRWLWSQVHSHFPNAQLISGFRPGAKTRSGSTSYHALGKAIDVTPSMAIFDWIANTWGRRTAELIYSPAGGRQIHNGQPHLYSAGVRADHWNHVHWAMQNAGGIGQQVGGAGLGALLAPLLGKLVGVATRGLRNLAGASPLGKLVAGAGTKLVEAAAAWLTGQAGGGGTGGAPGGSLSPAERWIIQRESGGRTTADNPTSTAFGLGQLLEGNRRYYGRILGIPYDTTDYNQQLAMFRAYVRDRYGTAERAQAFWMSHGWYGNGLDAIARKPTMIGVGERGPERVTVTPLGGAAGGRGITVADARLIAAELAKVIPTRVAVDDIHAGLLTKRRRSGGTSLGLT